MDMRKDTTTPTDAAKLDTIKAADAHQQTTSAPASSESITAAETVTATETTSGRPAQQTSPGDLHTITPATSGHLDSIEAQEPRKEGRKRRKDNTSAAAHNRYKAKAYDRLNLEVIKGDKERLQAAAARLDISITALIIEAVNAYTGEQTLTPKAKNPYI